MRAPLIGLLFLALLVASVAHAVDGLIPINQRRALAGGVTPGDSPGFPVLISVPGSYRLASDLTLTDPDTDGIQVAANFVQIDLNGFTIRGPNTWAGGTADCTAEGTGVGIQSQAAGGIVVSNGRVFGMGGAGIFIAASNNRLTQVIAEQNCDSGFRLGNASLVIDSIARRNHESGFVLGQNSRIGGSIADLNGNSGIILSNFGTVERCAANANAELGISAGNGCSIRRSQANNNGISGIQADVGSLVLDGVTNGNSVVGIRGQPSGSPPQVGSGGNVSSGSAFNYMSVVHLYCELDNTTSVCAP